jgi:hypothetical protein
MTTVSANSTAASAPTNAVAPVPQRAAIAILGSMIFLIIALMGVLVQTTWVDPASAAETPSLESESLAGRWAW